MGKTKLDFRKLELEPTSSTKELLKNLESAQTLLEATEQDAARPSEISNVAIGHGSLGQHAYSYVASSTVTLLMLYSV